MSILIFQLSEMERGEGESISSYHGEIKGRWSRVVLWRHSRCTGKGVRETMVKYVRGELCKQINHHSDTCKHIGGIFYITIYNQCNNHQTSPSQMSLNTIKSNGGGNTVPKLVTHQILKLRFPRHFVHNEIWIVGYTSIRVIWIITKPPPPQRAALWVSSVG